MKKVVVAILLCVVFSLSGCGGTDETVENLSDKLATEDAIEEFISEKATKECYRLLDDIDRPISVLITNEQANITIRAQHDFCLPPIAEELVPVALEALEENDTDLGRISVSYYRTNSDGVVDGSMVDWTTKDGETGTFASEPDDIIETNYAVDDLWKHYSDYKDIINFLESGADYEDFPAYAESVKEAEYSEKFGDTLDAYQGEWEATDSKYERLIISDDTLNFVYESTIGSKSYCDVNTFYFGYDEAENLVVMNQHSQPRYTISLGEDGTLTITDISGGDDARVYEKISDNTEVPEEKVEPAIGMTEAEVYASTWGAPQKVNTTTTAAGKREQWVYEDGYIYLDNGIVTTIQER